MEIVKKRHIDKGYWLELQQRIVDSGFVTITINPANGKQYWKTTPKGIKAYKTVLELTDENRLFKGPKFTENQLKDFQYNDEGNYEKYKKWMIACGMLRPVYDEKLDRDTYELTEYAYEFYQTYVDLLSKGRPGVKNPLKGMAKATMMAIWFLVALMVKSIINNRMKNERPTKDRW